MTVLGASKPTNAHADGFAALRAGKTASSSTSPMSQAARTCASRPFEISFLAAPATAAATSTSLKVTNRRPLTVTEVAFPVFVNDHERSGPEEATQGSSVQTAAT